MRKLLFSIAFLCAMFSNAQTAPENQSVTENDLNVVLQSIVNKLEKLKGVQEEMPSVKAVAWPFVNGHEYVDLGLSVKWATMNVGATEVAGSKKNSHTGKLDCYGEYYAWGETSPKDTYTWSNLKYCTSYDTDDEEYTFSKYVCSSTCGTVDGKSSLELTDDAARANWGGTWRMPSNDEFKELCDNCYWEWTTSYNNTSVKGYIVYKVKDDNDKGIKKVSGSSPMISGSYSLSDTHIFLPASGYRWEGSFWDVGYAARYWTKSLSISSTSNYAYTFRLGLNYASSPWDCNRYRGHGVRAVCP